MEKKLEPKKLQPLLSTTFYTVLDSFEEADQTDEELECSDIKDINEFIKLSHQVTH